MPCPAAVDAGLAEWSLGLPPDESGLRLLPLHPLGLARVVGNSMAPALTDGDYVIYRRRRQSSPAPALGSMVVFRLGGTNRSLLVKRVVALGGARGHHGQMEYGFVPARHVYVLGDNRQFSSDSREFGAIPVEDLIGEVVVRIHLPHKHGATDSPLRVESRRSDSVNHPPSESVRNL